MKADPTDVDKAYAAYRPRSLRFYDWWFYEVLNPKVWDCPTGKLVKFYREHLSGNHLEAGAGTGYLLERALGEDQDRLVLLDINRDCLDYAASRLEFWRPDLFQENMLERMDLPGDGFDSIAVNYVFHRLPGSLEQKAGLALDHLAPHLNEGGTLFGTSILGIDVQRSRKARMLMKHFNRRGIFSNRNDSLGSMMEALSTRFKTFNVEVHGCVVLFWCRGLRDSFRERMELESL